MLIALCLNLLRIKTSQNIPVNSLFFELLENVTNLSAFLSIGPVFNKSLFFGNKNLIIRAVQKRAAKFDTHKN